MPHHPEQNRRCKIRKPQLFIFRPNEHLRTIYPTNIEQPPIDPNDYYITSGEAVAKAKQLRIDIEQLGTDNLKHEPTPENNHSGVQVQAALHEIDHLMEKLAGAKGDYVYLECTHEEGQVICRPVNPRSVSNRNRDAEKRKGMHPVPRGQAC